MAFINQYDEMQDLKNENLEYFAPTGCDFVQGQAMPYDSYSGSVGSPGSGASPPYTESPLYTGAHDTGYQYYYPTVPAEQVFFPPDFNPTEPMAYSQWDAYTKTRQLPNLPAGLETNYGQPFHLQPVPEAKMSLKKRRASRSKCPCVKCCQAKAAGKPSPVSHACIVLGCPKTYTRPAHLRTHLKTHETELTTKCQLCSKTLLSCELVSHMLRHGVQRKFK